MFRKFLKLKTPEEPQEEAVIDLNLLEEHLDSIKVCLLEIRAFRKKKIVRSPTFHFMQNIDIEEAWPSCRETLREAYDLLCHVAENLGAEHEAMSSSASFGVAIDQFVNLTDRIVLFLETTGDSAFSEMNPRMIDEAILKVQGFTNLLQRRVMVDFVFTRNPAS